MARSGTARAWVVTTAVLAGPASAALLAVAIAADPDTAGQAASVAGTVVGLPALLALLVSAIALFRTGDPAAGARSVQSGGTAGRAVAELARRTPNPSLRASAPARVPTAPAKTDRPGGATEAAHGITEPSHQASALVAVAKVRGRSPEGRSLLRHALSVHTHEDFLGELAAVSPEALDEALRRIRQPATP